MYLECHHIYQNYWKEAVKDVVKCKPRLQKRQAIALASIGRIVATSGTNFLLNKLVPSREDRNVILQKVAAGLDIPKMFKQAIAKLISITSDAVFKHPNEFQQSAQLYSITHWVSGRIIGEIIANTANLKVIEKMCRRDMVATTELGELTEDLDLQLIPSGNTEMNSVSLGTNPDSISFDYTTYTLKNKNQSKDKDKEIPAASLVIYVSACILFLVAYSITCIVMAIAKTRKTKSQTGVDEVNPPNNNQELGLAFLPLY